MKYAIVSGAAGGLANQVINSIKDDYFIFAIDKSNTVIDIYKNNENLLEDFINLVSYKKGY